MVHVPRLSCIYGTVFFSRRLMCKLNCTTASQVTPWSFVVCDVFCDFLPSYSIKQYVLV